jgi:hypothetical protein
MTHWIKNTKGEPSASLTLVIVAFTVVMLWMVASIFITPWVAIMPFNASEAMLVLTPLLGLYWGRRRTDVDERSKLTNVTE